ncbi:MAG: bifunctional UDP-N-acetylglucosamine diphosphorylase/glucosamine-1-phosphate N-acetyltransferase GlmU [Deltaproteobacteria bacterium]|nr:bifunctional UDP-N-acetylglucosamine diphosphorylase/glucosamine-1-phosphate N-acetyltransferase GlmU [Candidatus Anaeroferrophillacea bacterium]
MDDVAAIVLAAGRGTRMKSDRAKVMHPVLGQPMLAWPLAMLEDVGVSRLVVVIGSGREEVMERFAAVPGIAFAWQREQRGTGDAAAAGMAELGDFHGTALIVCGDVPLLTAGTVAELVAVHRRREAAVSVLTAVFADPGAYGRVIVGADGGVERIIEARDAAPAELEERRINSGTYCVDADFLRGALARLDCNNAQGEYYLTDIVGIARGNGLPVAWLDVADNDDIKGINNRVQLGEAEAVMAARVRRRHQHAGVTIGAPGESVTIEAGAEIGTDTVIEKGATIAGDSVIGSGVHIGQGAIIRDSRLGDGVKVRPYSVIEDSIVEDGVVIGPFARLRTGTVLRAGARVGNFVETKKAELGPGSKANHLSYIGDAEIGAGVNIGAGTITCNYDGFAKYRTVIEDGVFIGSDTQLVAPVRVGRDALVGAGSTITRDVPENAVAASRSRQTVVDGRGMASRRERRKDG